MKWVEWVEPFGPSSEPVYMRVSAETAIAYMRQIHPGVYQSDEDALDDFIVINGATVREEASATEPRSGVCIE